MGQEFIIDADLNNNRIINVRLERLASLPTEVLEDRLIKVGDVTYIGQNGRWMPVADAEALADVKSTADANKEAIGDATSGLTQKVANIEKALGGSGEGGDESLATKVVGLRTDLGTKSDEASATGTAFARIAQNAAGIATNAGAISANADAIAEVKKTADGAKTKSDANESAIGTLQTDVTKAKSDITALQTAVGTGAEGLSTKVAKNAEDIVALTTTVNENKTAADTELAKKVDKVTGKGLSTEDYTTVEKTKLEGIATGAQVNVIESVKVDGSALAVDGKAVNIDLSGYAKKSDISSAYKFEGSVAFATLPSNLGADDKGKVYNVTDAFKDGDKTYPAGTNVAWTGTAWDPLAGYTDFSIYAEKTTVASDLAKKQDNLSEAQLAAANSGITATKVGTYDGYSALITAAKEAADAAQGTADKAVVANAIITGATKCKVTYDAKGLVTKGEDLVASDIPELAFGSGKGKVAGTLPYSQSPIGAATFDATIASGSASINTGFTTVLVAQVFDTNNTVIFCQTTVTGGTVALQANKDMAVKVNVIGLK